MRKVAVGLSRACLVTLSALVVEFGLGMWLNLYAQVPSADRHAGVTQQIKNGPLSLTVHAGVGAILLVAALVVLIVAVRARGARVIVLAVVGLGAIGGAAAAGELFVRDQQSKMSLAMAALTGIALLCYIYLQTLASAARIAQANPRRDDPAEPAPYLPRRPAERRARGQSRPPWETETSVQPVYLPQQDWPADNRRPRRRNPDDFGPEQR